MNHNWSGLRGHFQAGMLPQRVAVPRSGGIAEFGWEDVGFLGWRLEMGYWWVRLRQSNPAQSGTDGRARSAFPSSSGSITSMLDHGALNRNNMKSLIPSSTSAERKLLSSHQKSLPLPVMREWTIVHESTLHESSVKLST